MTVVTLIQSDTLPFFVPFKEFNNFLLIIERKEREKRRKLIECVAHSEALV